MDKKNFLSRRVLMTTFGTLLAGFSVGLFKNSAFGVDPFQSMCLGIYSNFTIDYGTYYTFLNLVLLVAMFFCYRKSVGIYTFVNMFLLGYMIDFIDKAIRNLIPSPGIGVRIVFLFGGLTVLSLGAAFIFSSDLGLSTYDWVAEFISEKIKKIPFKYARIFTDLVCCGLGLLFGVAPGIATLFTAFCMGPEISFFRLHLTDKMIPEDK